MLSGDGLDIVADLFSDDGFGAPGDQQLLDELRIEHQRERIGIYWLRELRTACRRVTRRYSPEIYGNSSSWDVAAIDDLLQDSVVRILVKSQLEYICDVAQDMSHVRALLHRQVKFTLADRRQTTLIDNIIGRSREKLSEAPFQSVVHGGEQAWALADGESRPNEAQDGIGPLVMGLRGLPRLPGNGTERGSALWTADVLSEALVMICSTMGPVTLGDIRKILSDALTFAATTEVVVDDGDLVESAQSLQPSDLVVAEEAITTVLGQLTGDERSVLVGKFRGKADGQIGHELEMSRPTVDSRKKSAISKIQEVLSEMSEGIQNYTMNELQLRLLEGQAEA